MSNFQRNVHPRFSEFSFFRNACGVGRTGTVFFSSTFFDSTSGMAALKVIKRNDICCSILKWFCISVFCTCIFRLRGADEVFSVSVMSITSFGRVLEAYFSLHPKQLHFEWRHSNACVVAGILQELNKFYFSSPVSGVVVIHPAYQHVLNVSICSHYGTLGLGHS